MIYVPTSFGELIDKITILEIKKHRISSPEKLHHIEDELLALCRIRDEGLQRSEKLDSLTEELLHINENLWEIEDAIRRCESNVDFGPIFVELARSVYKQNDKRALLKKRINEFLHSDLVEEKSYVSYREQPSIIEENQS